MRLASNASDWTYPQKKMTIFLLLTWQDVSDYFASNSTAYLGEDFPNYPFTTGKVRSLVADFLFTGGEGIL